MLSFLQLNSLYRNNDKLRAEVASHMRHSVQTAARFYDDSICDSQAAKTSKLISKILQNQAIYQGGCV